MLATMVDLPALLPNSSWKRLAILQANISSRFSETAPTPLMSDVRYTRTEFNITDPTTNDEVADIIRSMPCRPKLSLLDIIHFPSCVYIYVQITAFYTY